MRITALLIVIALLLGAGAVQGAASPAPGPQLRLHRMSLSAQTPNRATAALSAAASGPYAIIQFRGPITKSDRAVLEQTGVTLLEYLPDYAYLVRGDAVQLDAAARLPRVYGRTPFTVADKLAPSLLRALARGDNTAQAFQVVGWPDDHGALQRDLRAAAVNSAAPLGRATLLQVASLPSVRWIEPLGHPRILNDQARAIMHVDTSAWQSRHLFGAGQIVAVTDSGLDTGLPATLSPDFAGRIIATQVLSAGGDLGDSNGHGTHVAGSVAGAGVQSGANPAQHQYAGSFAGVAPEAGLVIQAFEVQADGAVAGLNPDYYTLFDWSYAAGARVHTNSWGDTTGPISDTEAAYGGYPYGSQRTDQFMWDHKDMAIFFAAGNSGADGTPGALGFCTGGDGVIDADSLLEPGTAKNVVTVGASESLRSTGGLSGLPWLLLSFCFTKQPIATDLISNNPDGMAAFSSRGPTDDGRAKPDIVAPGTNIVSARSHYPNAGTLWGQYETNANYAYSGGTSMATPLAAGAGVLVREWLVQHGIADPSAAAVKATLLDTAYDMAPGQYGTGVTQEIPSTRPNSVDGWGRVDLGFMDAPPPYGLWVDDHTSGIATDEEVDYTNTLARPLEVLDSSQPLRVMLAWTDPPASLSAASQLVNDLDLSVTGPGGVVYHGNNAATGDRLNNVEGVVVNNPPVGQYTVQVRGHNVPIMSQPYGLTVAGPITRVGQMTLTKTAEPSVEVRPGALITYTLSLGAGNLALAQPVTLSDTLPLNVSFVSASDGGTLNGGVVSWSIPALAANATVTRTLVVRVGAQVADNTPIVNADYRAENGFDLPGVGQPVTVTARTAPQMTLTKTANPPVEVRPGGLITYTLSLGAGNLALAQPVTLTDTLPLNVSFVSASNGGTLNGEVVSWSIPALAANATVTRTLVVRVGAQVADNMPIVNADYRAENGFDLPGVGQPVTVTVHIPPRGVLTLSKTAELPPGVQAGKLITYTLKVGAQNAPISGIVLSDTLPVSTTFVSASGAYTRSGPNNSVVTWPIGGLAAGQTVTRTLTVQVALDVFNQITISNVSYRVTAADADPVVGLPVRVPVQAPPPHKTWFPLLIR